jgi:hypothetical protein
VLAGQVGRYTYRRVAFDIGHSTRLCWRERIDLSVVTYTHFGFRDWATSRGVSHLYGSGSIGMETARHARAKHETDGHHSDPRTAHTDSNRSSRMGKRLSQGRGFGSRSLRSRDRRTRRCTGPRRHEVVALSTSPSRRGR